MSKKITTVMLTVLIASLFLVTGCFRQNQLNELIDLPVSGNTGKSLSAAQVKKGIIEGAAKRDWATRELSPGVITATLTVRAHVATVEIPYSGSSFSIVYKDSENLDYDAKDGTIHNQYNNWVNYLKHDINSALSKMK